MSKLEQRLSSLSAEKLALLMSRMRAQAGHEGRAIRRHAGEGPHPLSFAQQRLWFLDQLEAGGASYNIPAALRLRGPLEVAALAASLAAIQRRHAVLRARFCLVEGHPQQMLADEDAPLDLADLRGVAPALREAEVARLAELEARRPFALMSEAPLRATLLRLAADEHVLLLTIHHIVADGWSLEILVRELGALYAAHCGGPPAELAELPAQYADYARWQHEQVGAGLLEAQQSYWLGRLRGWPQVLELPTDRPRPPELAAHGARHTFAVPPELLAGLRALAREEQATPAMVLLAAFEVLLFRYSGQEGFCVGMPVAGRGRVELEPLIGLFVNTLALRADLSGSPDFRTLLRRVRDEALGAYAHPDLPFELLVELLQPERDAGRTPLFQVMFDMQGDPLRLLRLGALEVSRVEPATRGAKTDLLLALEERANGLHGALEYRSDLFDAATIARMADHYLTLLTWIVADPARPVEALPLLSEAERRQLLVEWNATAAPFPHERCVQELFEEQAARAPATPAVLYEERALSYGELNRRANQLARHLRGLGVGPGALVGLCLERSPELIVGLLGILKAGAAYLPLDPDYPAERLALMLADAGVAALVTRQALGERLAAPGAALVCLDNDGAAIAGEAGDDLPCASDPAQPAYVIYTSGSTGRPKGVLISHRAVVNLGAALRRIIYAQVGGPLQRISLNAPIAFDASVQQIVMLCFGHTLDILPQEVRLDGRLLVEYVRRRGIEVLDCVPSQLKLLLAEGLFAGDGPAPRLVLPGGEALDDATWRALAQAPATEFYNVYGPTECTVDATAACARRYPERATIGRPLDNVRLYILDRLRQPVPIGVAGEIYIGGAGVGLGYLNRPELSAEKFVADPFSVEVGARLYRTGDLGRYRPDGSVEFLGRADQQVKLRGFRIELGEIEALLRERAELGEVAVALREDVPGDQRLVVYMCPRSAAAPAVDELRAWLRARLPEHMVPVAFCRLTALPLTPSGKLDRRALPAPDPAAYVGAGRSAAPRTPVEELIAAIWADLLGLKQVGVEDNFFALGGHSLLATRVTARVQAALGAALPVRALFEAPTVAALAERVASVRRGVLAPLRPAPRAEPPAASFAQQRLWFLSQLSPESPLYTIAGGLRLSGTLDVAALEQALAALQCRHESLRTSFVLCDGRLCQLIAPEPVAQLEQRDLRQLPAQEREPAAERDLAEFGRQPFDLERGPLFRARLLRLADEEHLLGITLHHTIADGWALGLLIGELGALYGASVRGAAPELRPLPLQYADFAVWQREVLRGELLEAQLGYWRRQLDGVPPLLELPTDRPRPVEQSYRGGRLAFTLPAELAEALRQLSREEGVTLFMTLLAGLQVLLSRYSGQDDICVGTPVAGRTRSELEPIVGCFVNTLVLRARLHDDLSFRELLRQVRETTLDAYTHQEVPFEMVVEAVEPERDLGYAPLFQVMFAFQHGRGEGVELPGLALRPLELAGPAAAYDLVLSVEETGAELRAALDYSSDLFDVATVARLAGHLEVLLGAVVADRERAITELPLLTAAERRLLLEEWNATAAPSDPRPVHERFAAQTAHRPEATALVFEGRRLSYGELNRRANQLAHHLRELGVGADTLVAISLERSPELVIAMLGVLKAGGAYLPLDPALPGERLAAMLADARPPALIVARASAATWLSGGDGNGHAGNGHAGAAPLARLVVIEADWPLIARQPETDPAVTVRPGDLAYVIYTSGSTGRPKGTLIEHRGLSNLADVLLDEFAVEPSSRVLQFASCGFDASVTEVVMALLAGAELHLARRELLVSPQDLLDLLREQAITTVTLPPSLLTVLPCDDLPALQTVASAGERCPVEVAARWSRGRRMLNGYGPTEVTVAATYHHVEALAEDALVVPIGRPIANTRLYVLDRQRQPVPLGVTGELYIGGVGVARGYLNQPELTAERFLADPFAETPGARMYRSGDLVRYRPDSSLEYLGRTDQQVKIRGYRIELGELETTLCTHPDIQDAKVLAREDGPAGRWLVGYVVPTEGWRAHGAAAAQDEVRLAADLRTFLRARLPDYMVPAVIVPLAIMPMTPNGKIDLRALPNPDAWRMPVEGYVAPRTPTEVALAVIWAQLLGVAQVGVNDNFFDLGGDSILSIQVVARANQAGLRVTTRQLFQHPTVAELAAVAGEAPASLAEPEPPDGPLPLTPIQRWFFEQNHPTPDHWNQAVLLEVRERLDPALLADAARELLLGHAALRLRFTRAPQGWSQHCAGVEAADQPLVHYYDLQGRAEAVWRGELEWATAELHTNLDLAEGPLLRIGYFDLGSAQPGRLLLVAHHLVIDSVSWRILLEDLQSVYTQLGAGRAATLPPPSASYGAWARRLAKAASAPELEAEAPGWLDALAAPAPRLPLDLADGPNEAAAERELAVALEAAPTAALQRSAAAAYGADLLEALLTALALTLGEWTGAPAQLIDLEGHGRAALPDGPDLSRTIGWFTSIYPLRLEPGRAAEPGAALRLVRAQLRRAREWGERYWLLRQLSPDPALRARLAALPQPELVVNYLGRLDAPADEAALFRLAAESAGPQHALDSPRAHLIALGAAVVGGRLELRWSYSARHHRRETIARLAQRCLDQLEALGAHCQAPDAGGHSPADFPDVALSQSDLDAILMELEVGEN